MNACAARPYTPFCQPSLAGGESEDFTYTLQFLPYRLRMCIDGTPLFRFRRAGQGMTLACRFTPRSWRLTNRKIQGDPFMAHEQYQSCIDECYACATASDHCAVSCLAEQDVKMMARCIQLDMDCAAICRLAASYMARGSEFAASICNACAEICDACAEECARHEHEHCRQCAEACRRCAAECRRMASGNRGSQARPAGVAAH